MPSTPLMACSSGVVTAVSTSWAFAPLKTAVTLICGGARLGYCATGIVGMASSPARMSTSEQTEARIGRRMKTSTNMTAALLRFHRGAVAQLLHARDDDAIAGLEAARHHVIVALDFTELHRP